MDDPWGSPWADEIQPPPPIARNKSHDSKVSLPPETLVQASSSTTTLQQQQQQQQQQTSSPWDDADDGLGDWAAAPQATGFGLIGAQEDWGGSIATVAPAKPRANGYTAAWNDFPTSPPPAASKLSPSPLPKPAELSRQHSPDPWALDFPTNDRSLELKQEVAGTEGISGNGGEFASRHSGLAEPDVQENTTLNNELVSRLELKNVDTSEDTIDGRAETTLHTIHNDTKRDGLDGASQSFENSGNSLSEDPDTASGPENETATEAEGEPPVGASVGLQTMPDTQEPPKILPATSRPSISQETSSRPSSSPSEDSHHGDILLDSPRTSLDEDTKRSQVQRKSSSKVRELVEHFDTLATKDETPELVRSRSVSAIRGRVDVSGQSDDEIDDFGDFEDGMSEAEDPAPIVSPQTPTAPAPASTTSKVSTEATEPVGQKSPRSPTPKREFGPVDFTVDITLLETVYKGIKEEAPVERCFIPDNVPYDSFTSTEERKTWYRISRYGPMRKHNMGDDENYTRVNWTQSQVRSDTLKIVARWIEEDRISGRVVLGGASKTGSTFGWNDPKAAPTSIEAAFASKARKKKVNEAVPKGPPIEVPREWPKGLVRDRSKSNEKSPSIPRRTSSVKSTQTPIMESKTQEQLPVADFDWNSGPAPSSNSQPRIPLTHSRLSSISTGVPSAGSPLPNKKRASLGSPLSTIAPVQATELAQKDSAFAPVAYIPASPKAQPFVANVPVAHTINDEDDWGEMISSPAVSTPPVLPGLKSLRHKKSQSLGGAFPPITMSQTSNLPSQDPDMGRAHRSTMSFDQILMPEKQNPVQVLRNEDSTPTNAFTSPIPVTAAPSLEAADPWDLSFFDTPAPPPPQSTSPTRTNPIRTRAVSFASTRQAPPPAGLVKSNEETEQEKLAQSIIRGLPDLSYMLRR